MSEDRKHPDRSTDDEFEAKRHVRFGKLPARVAPEDQVETTDTDPPPEGPGEPQVRREWG
ncbi:hypothetical protein [Micromonospora echinaurantiaca]|jgi:hypothetical protein|uniref:Uncharacterized protein n=1 Tax=Micromonospora echinaurantiaca TaxID=47857 RepID=A0A1C5JNA6_9ACTN|nr:hypothetical protein [Micromonospora echinaurantiaca]SCG71811.1 hypothetical protein GA0070609_4629 [Micromonospora echinaurantiaca]